MWRSVVLFLHWCTDVGEKSVCIVKKKSVKNKSKKNEEYKGGCISLILGNLAGDQIKLLGIVN